MDELSGDMLRWVLGGVASLYLLPHGLAGSVAPLDTC